MAAHRLKHVKAADGSSVVESPEELRLWVASRKRNFPCPANEKRKAEEDDRRRRSGALEESKSQPSMLEKLLRSSHGLKGNKGKGKFGKGKDKGKGKFGKGKDKNGKGKGKGKGKAKGKSWGKSNYDDWQHVGSNDAVAGAVAIEHVTKELPLPSMVANCVALEAPFGSAPLQQHQQIPQRRRICKYFQQGHCFHGANCQYDHTLDGKSEHAALEDIRTAWWVLPSTLANRVCGLGEGPAAYHGVERQPRAPRYEAPERPEDRPRRDGLLRRLLQADVDRYYSTILQCVRYIVATDFFRLEKVPLPPNTDGAAVESAAQPLGLMLADASKDLEAASRAIAGNASGSFTDRFPKVELAEEELLELAKVLEV
jgi:hypothetical protein